MQTRPGNEPEREPDEPSDETEATDRDPFTPKVRPADEGDAGLDETVSLQSPLAEEPADEREEPEESAAEEDAKEPAERPERSKHRGTMSSETLKRPTPDTEAAESGDEPAEQAEESAAESTGEGEKDRPAELAETVDLQDLPSAEPAAAAETPRDLTSAESPAAAETRQDLPGAESAAETTGEGEKDLAETVNLRDLLPEEPPAEDSKPKKISEPEKLAETVNLRDLLPEDAASAEQPEPPLRRRTEGEPPYRRPGPGGQPPRRPGQDPRRVPHAGEPGPKRRPPSERPPQRRPAPEPRPAAPASAAATASGPAAPKPAPSVSLGRRRLFAALWPPRLSRNQAVVGVLLGVLGAALAIQVHATNTSDQILRGARADDLVNILDEVTSRGQSLDAELRTLETQNATIQDSTDKAQAALSQAQQKAKDLQILSGTVKAKGSGITMTITDPQSQMKSATLLNALEELRAAGAEVIQVNDVRVVVSSSFVDTGDGHIALDGHVLTPPYVYKVIGDPNTLGPAMQIPGGVVPTVKSTQGANATIAPGQVLVDAVVPTPNPEFAKAG